MGETISYDEERKVSHEYKDALGRRVGHKDALDNEIAYEFNSKDLLTKIIDPKFSETLFGYDSQGRKVCKLDPVTGLTSYSYNSENLVIQKNMYGFVSGHNSCSLPTGVLPRTVLFEYTDNLNRMTKMDFPSSSNTEDVIYNYDELASSYPIGRLTSVDFGVGSKKLDYDIFGNQHKTTLHVGIASYVTEKKFDVLGRIEEMIYPTIGSNALGIKYSFDASSQLVEVKDSSTNFIYAGGMTYSPMNQVETVEFGNNTKATMSYDDINQSYRLVNLLTEKIGTPNTTIQNISYDYDKVSNVTQRDDVHNSFIENYSFDDLHRIVSASLGGTPKSWSFDEIGNITSNNGIPYVYGPLRNQIITSVGSDSYGFDLFGNITQDASRTYVFDWNNRLRSVTKSTQTTTYDYGEDGLRVMKTTPSQTTVFVDKYTELRGSDVVRHIYANDQLIASIDELNDVTYNHKDHLGSSNLKTDSIGNVVKRIEYVPFGDKRVEVGSYNNIKNRFTGQYEDEESGLYYYQQRYYDPVLSRFITADPLYLEEMDKRGVNSQELNLYSYVKNNPINFTDPNGLLGLKFTTSIGADVGLGRSYSFGVAVAWNKEGNMSMAFTNGKETSLGAQVGVGGDVIKVGVSNAEHVKDMGGLGAGVSGGVAEFKWGLGGSVGYEQGSNDQGKTIKEFSFGLSYGWGAGIGKISASEGEIGIIKDETVKPESLYQHQADQSQATQDTSRSDSLMDFGN